jgi:hypothetical protein
MITIFTIVSLFISLSAAGMIVALTLVVNGSTDNTKV